MTTDRTWITAQIESRRTEAEDIVSLKLVDPRGGELPSFSAGSHIDVEIEPGMIRQYSLCNSETDRTSYLIAVLRDPQTRGASAAIHDRFHEGQIVRISAPRNHFPLHSSGGTSLLIGGGIGITPLLCMAERLQRANGRFALHYCTRSPERTAFRDYISSAPLAASTRMHFDSDGPAGRFDAVAAFRKLQPGDNAYVCGPTGFINWIDEAATAAGWPRERLHREYFAADPDSHTSENRSFELLISSTGKLITVGADESAAVAMERAGLGVPISCDQGVCGTCITRVLEGEPDHRDLLGLEGNQEFTPCCSRAKSARLVLDV